MHKGEWVVTFSFTDNDPDCLKCQFDLYNAGIAYRLGHTIDDMSLNDVLAILDARDARRSSDR